MANVRFAYSNLIDLSTTTFTETSQASGLPVENISNDLRTKVWQTDTSVADENVVIDLGSATAFTCIIILDHDLTAGDSAIALEANASDAWGAPSFTQNLTRVEGPIVAWFSSQSYRYARLKFTKSAAGESRQIGRVFLGTYYDSAEVSDFSIKKKDNSKAVTSIGGQDYIDVRSIYDELKVGFDLITKAVNDSLQTMVDTVGVGTPLFISLNNDVEPVNWVYYVRFRSLPTFSPVNSTNYWRTDMSFKELL